MENDVNESFSQKGLVNELVEGRDLTKQLLQLMFLSKEPHFSSNNEMYGYIAQNILAKFEKSLQILQYDPTNQSQVQQTTTDSAFSGSPKSQDSDGDFKDPIDHKNDPKKMRKNVPRVTIRVQGCTSSGLEGPIEDGYNWRKYGQKDIHGAKFPRAYYKCSNRHDGCFASKLVQRREDDPASFDVTYLGKHNCSQASSSSSSSSFFLKNPNPKLEPFETLAYPHCQQSKETMLVFKNDNVKNFNNKSFSFSFPSSNSSINPQQTTSTRSNYNTNFVDHANFSTNPNTSNQYLPCIPNITLNDQNENNVNVSHGSVLVREGSYSSSTSAIAPDIPFDQVEFNYNFFTNNPHYFQ